MNNTGQGKINIYCILKDVLRDIWVAVIVGISASLLLYVAARVTYQPEYTSRTTFVVSAKGSTSGPYANLSKIDKMMEVFEVVMDSQVLKNLVCEDLGVSSFDGTVKISQAAGTNLLTVSVTSNSPDVAFRLLKSMLKCYPIVGTDVLGEVVLEIFEEPAYPSRPNNTIQDSSVRKQGFLLGMAAMIVVLALLSYFKDTVKNVKDIPEMLDTTELAVLRHEKKYRNLKEFLLRKKRQHFIFDPTVGFGYAETIKKIRTKLLYKMKKSGKKIIFVTSTLRGEGKSTVAVNLAEAMGQRYEHVLLIDGDLRKAGLHEMLGIAKDEFPDWSQALTTGQKLEDTIYKPENRKFSVMLNASESRHSTELLASKKMKAFLEQMYQEMDVIIIDGPPAKRRSDAEIWARISDISL